MAPSSVCPCQPGDVGVIRPVLGGREREVLVAWFLCETKSVAASELFVSVNTVKKHIERAREKYAAAGRPAPTQALLLIRGLQDGWIDLNRLLLADRVGVPRVPVKGAGDTTGSTENRGHVDVHGKTTR